MTSIKDFQALDGTIIRGYQPPSLDHAVPSSHPRLLADFQNRGELKKWAYSPLEMAEFLSIAHGKYIPSEEAKELISSPIPKTETREQFQDVMTTWAKVFDSWLFADSLHDSLGKLVFLEDPEQPRAYFETDAVDGHEANTIFINLRSSSREIGEWPEYKGTFEEFYIATLLHEMVHAFCNVYHCQKACCKEQTWHPSTGGIGCDGHGQPFSEGLKCLLDALVAEGLAWAVDPIALGLGNSVVFSMFINLWQPEEKQLENWNVPIDKFGHVDAWYPLRQEAIADGEFDPTEYS